MFVCIATRPTARATARSIAPRKSSTRTSIPSLESRLTLANAPCKMLLTPGIPVLCLPCPLIATSECQVNSKCRAQPRQASATSNAAPKSIAAVMRQASAKPLNSTGARSLRSDATSWSTASRSYACWAVAACSLPAVATPTTCAPAAFLRATTSKETIPVSVSTLACSVLPDLADSRGLRARATSSLAKSTAWSLGRSRTRWSCRRIVACACRVRLMTRAVPASKSSRVAIASCMCVMVSPRLGALWQTQRPLSGTTDERIESIALKTSRMSFQSLGTHLLLASSNALLCL
mmetsp:Transcript_69897/g.138355  ORF Transcript_69897/g.138355 Transcript_69897/m.138355 type:complete len:292 (-) Transcript_69897:880-1755(-)